MRRAGAMNHLPGNDKALPRIERDGTLFEIDEQLAIHNVEELVIRIVLVPVILTFQHAKADDGVVYLAERLVVPLKFASVGKSLGVDEFQWFVQNIQASLVRILLGFTHRRLICS
jgi:hypothetical protein